MPKNVILVSVQKTHFAVRICKKTRFNTAPYNANSTNLREFGASYRNGTVFAKMECLYQIEAEGMLCRKM